MLERARSVQEKVGEEPEKVKSLDSLLNEIDNL